MPETFKPGDQVKLKSGGPVMTVSNITGDRWVHTQWFSGGKLNDGAFDPESLVRVKKKPADEE